MLRTYPLMFFALALSTACARRSALDDFAHGGVVECSFDASIRTWLDTNRNQEWDQGEPALSQVALVVTSPSGGRRWEIETDSEGHALFSMMFGGCGTRYAFAPLVPDSLQLTTTSRRTAWSGDRLFFGFARRGA
jgi:hypothetical protein